jgi:hypothetical protein
MQFRSNTLFAPWPFDIRMGGNLMHPEAETFWKFFDDIAAPRLAHREATFRATFQHLDRFSSPITIIETGCVRLAENWAGDGQSTILFDKYVTSRGNHSRVYSVDINREYVELCRTLVSNNVTVTASDSVSYLNTLTKQFVENRVKANLLYLDSFDLDLTYWFPSASHHLKELIAAWRSIDKQSLVVVDDCPLTAQLIQNKEGGFGIIGEPSVGGKGRLVAEFAQQVGAEPMFRNYQAGWVGF